MKYVMALLIAGIMISCGEETTETKEVEEQVSPPVENSGAETELRRSQEATEDSNRRNDEDTVKRTSIEIGEKGASVKTRSGKGASVDEKGVRVESKKVKIDIKRDSN